MLLLLFTKLLSCLAFFFFLSILVTCISHSIFCFEFFALKVFIIKFELETWNLIHFSQGHMLLILFTILATGRNYFICYSALLFCYIFMKGLIMKLESLVRNLIYFSKGHMLFIPFTKQLTKFFFVYFSHMHKLFLLLFCFIFLIR